MMVKVMLVIELIEIFYIFEYEFFFKKIILKFYSLILEAKLPINHVKVFFFSTKSIDTKNLTKHFTLVSMAN